MTDAKTKRPTLPFDPFAMARSAGDLAWGLAAKPAELLEVQLAATRQWGDFWAGALSPPEPVGAPHAYQMVRLPRQSEPREL